MKSWMPSAVALFCVVLLPGTVARAEGLRLGDRETRATLSSSWPQSSSATLPTLLVGDYFFARPSFSWWPASGLPRASTGLVLSSRSGHGLHGPDSGNFNSSLPYVGLGYSGLAPMGGWSILADFGLVAHTRGLGHLFGSQGFDRALRELRELRFTPVLQLGVRYSF